MRNEPFNQPVLEDAGAAVASAPSRPLPDINAETNPFDTVEHLLDQAAHFNLYSVPVPNDRGAAVTMEGNSAEVVGFRIHEVLHRFDVSIEPPTGKCGLRAMNRTGEPVGRFDHRWMLIPDDFEALPDREPPPTPLNQFRSQRFVMLDGACSFGDGRDGFYGFGTGVTYPSLVSEPRCLLAAAVGNIMNGFGRFAGHEGTYTYSGALDPQKGFSGSFLCRVVDPDGSLSTEGSLPSCEAWTEAEPGITWIVLRGEKESRSEKTTYNFGPNGDVTGLNVSQQLKLVSLDCAATRYRGLRASTSVGPVVGRMTSRILFNLLNPGAPGTGIAPIPFRAQNRYTFIDRDGRAIGGFAANGGEGRTFNLKLVGAPGQAALRFGGFGAITEGTGLFEYVKGLMTDNSAVGVAPHALSTLYTFRLSDPKARYRAAFGANVLGRLK
jgi:hypothetical protein